MLVSAPVKDASDPVLNIVYGVNHDKYDPAVDHIVTAASCTTNCLAPVVNVIQSKLGIVRGSITTIHNVTNTQARSVITLVPIRPRWRGERRSLRTFPRRISGPPPPAFNPLPLGAFQLHRRILYFLYGYARIRPSWTPLTRGRAGPCDRPRPPGLMNLAPTSTGSATAIALIFPELKGKLNGSRRARASAERVRSTMSASGRTDWFHTVRPRSRRERRFF